MILTFRGMQPPKMFIISAFGNAVQCSAQTVQTSAAEIKRSQSTWMMFDGRQMNTFRVKLLIHRAICFGIVSNRNGPPPWPPSFQVQIGNVKPRNSTVSTFLFHKLAPLGRRAGKVKFSWQISVHHLYNKMHSWYLQPENEKLFRILKRNM